MTTKFSQVIDIFISDFFKKDSGFGSSILFIICWLCQISIGHLGIAKTHAQDCGVLLAIAIYAATYRLPNAAEQPSYRHHANCINAVAKCAKIFRKIAYTRSLFNQSYQCQQKPLTEQIFRLLSAD